MYASMYVSMYVSMPVSMYVGYNLFTVYLYAHTLCTCVGTLFAQIRVLYCRRQEIGLTVRFNERVACLHCMCAYVYATVTVLV